MNDLLNEICFVLKKNGIDNKAIVDEIIVALSKYEISQKSTALTTYTSVAENENLIKRFLLDKIVKGLTEKSLRYYERTLKFVFNSKIQKPILDVTPDDIRLYMANRQLKDGVTDVTLGNEYRVISSFYTWANKQEIITSNPLNKVDKPKQRKKKKHAFTALEVEQMRSQCKTPREKALIEVLLSTWCRVSEVASMNIDDIEGDHLTVVGKGEKERTVYLNSKAIIAIDEYIKSRHDNSPALFVSQNAPYRRLGKGAIEKLCKKIGESAGVSDAHPHRFRRTGATLALQIGMPVQLISKMLGHESLDTTQIYLDISENEISSAHKKYVI